VANHTEARQNQNVYFRVPEKPKKMLIEDWIAARSWRKEVCTKQTITPQHGDSTGPNWQ